MIKNQWALGALIAGILTIVIQLLVGTGGIILMIIAIVCGIMGLINYKKKPEIKGKWLSIAGIIVAIMYIFILFLPIFNSIGNSIGYSNTTTQADKENIVGLWADKDDIKWLFTKDGILYQGFSFHETPEEIRQQLIEENNDSFYYYKLDGGRLYFSYNQTYPENGIFTYQYKFSSVDTLNLKGITTFDDELHRIK
jgi:hypothetical protein